LTQRCLTEEIANSEIGDHGSEVDGHGASTTTRSSQVVREEVDAILENLLMARRDLVGQQLDRKVDDGTSSSSDDENEDMEENVDVNYAELITNPASATRVHNADSLSKQLQSEYTSLRDHWKTVLNKLHSNLTLHSGMSVNHSKFQSKAVDVSFWEQVQSGTEHERFQHQSTTTAMTTMDVEESDRLQFDDSKLYQQMLKDFISSSKSGSSGSGAVTSSTNHRGLDPAQEAAERLKRAMRKKSGGNVENIDLTSFLTEEEEYSAMKKKTTTTATGGGAGTSVDRRASKGRKIRYTVHPKLVNFMFPVSRPEPMISDDTWFKSLFGGVGNFR